MTLLWFSFNLPEFMILSIFHSWTQLLFCEESLLLLINSFILLLTVSAFLFQSLCPCTEEREKIYFYMLCLSSHQANVLAFRHPFWLIFNKISCSYVFLLQFGCFLPIFCPFLPFPPFYLFIFILFPKYVEQGHFEPCSACCSGLV